MQKQTTTNRCLEVAAYISIMAAAAAIFVMTAAVFAAV